VSIKSDPSQAILFRSTRKGRTPEVHFGLSEEQELLQETVRRFAAAECPPARLRDIFDAGTGHDDTIWRGLAEMGLTGLAVPEEFDGAGLEMLELALCCEIAGDAGLPGALLEHALACRAIAEGGSDEQRERWLPGLAAGQTIGTVALGEEGDRWQPNDWTLRSSDGKLNGSKHCVPHLAHAGLVIVGVEGGGLAVLELPNDSKRGIGREAQEGIDRTRTLGRLMLEDAAAEPLANASPACVRKLLDAGLVGLAADAFGAATRLIQLSVDYAKNRKQFGLPIAQFQAVKHQLARMATEIEPTRALLWYAAHALDQDLPDAERHAAMAKAHITAKTTEVARSAVEIHGGLGFTWECDVQMWFKRAMYDRSFLGTPEVHRERMAALAGW
jgi:alkylation response protein AidB-like acyl-CoA dehydrogenase